MTRLGVGVVGIGFIGAAHIDAVRRIPGAEVVAIASASLDRAECHARDLGVPRAYGDWRELIKDPDVRVVHNCTPNVLHFPINKAVLEAGIACFSEKPLTMTWDEARSLLDVARACAAPAAVNYNHRGFPQAQEARARVAAGELGALHAVHGSYLQDWLLSDRVWNWRLDTAQGGPTRAVADIGSHWMDLVQHVAGARIVAVMADLATVVPTRLCPDRAAETFGRPVLDDATSTPVAMETEDFASVLLRFDNGARGSFTVSQVSAGRKNRLSFEVDGARGALAWTSEESELLWLGSREEATRVVQRNPRTTPVPELSRLPAGHAEGWSDALTTVVRGFYAHVNGAERPPWVATFEDGANGVRLAEAILASHRAERWVTLDSGW